MSAKVYAVAAGDNTPDATIIEASLPARTRAQADKTARQWFRDNNIRARLMATILTKPTTL
jgi:hypothetical protein